MDQSLINHKVLFKRFLIFFSPLICIVALLSWAIYYFQHIKTQEEVLCAHESDLLGMQKEFVQQTIRSIVSDIKVISAGQELQDLLANKTQKNTSDIHADFLSFSKYKGIYDQVRVLDNTGMEIVRVDLRGSQPFLVPDDKLQFKGKRYYFKDTHKLKRDEIFMSPLDLNIERGEIEKPLKPMIRFGMPIFSRNGKKQGVLILNYLGQKLFENIERLSFASPGHLMVLNAEGFWLKGMQPEDEWGFMFEDRYERKLQQQYPTVWQKILQDESGQIFYRDGLVTYTKIYPLKEGIISSSGSPKPFQESVGDLSPDEYFWVIISHVLPSELHKRGDTFVLILLLTDLAFLTLLGFVTWQFIVANARRRLAEKALKKANKELERTVEQRTEELSNANIALKRNIEELNKAVNEKLKAESQLRQAQKMESIGTLAGGIAHDFNNILTPIMGYAEIAAKQLEHNSPLHNDMNEILAASNRAKDLVGQILTFSHQTEREFKPIKIQLVIKEALKLLRSSIPTTIEIQKDINPECRAVLADPTQVHQIIMNLCTNAYHAMREKGGVLSISLSEIEICPEDYQAQLKLDPGNHLKLEVSDTGSGMTQELQERIFEPYFTTKETAEGTGLGLSVVHGIILSLNGHISVYSEPGQGTTFHIYLPTVESNSIIPDEILTEEIPGGTENVLVVDDEEAIMKLEKRILENLGYKVTGLTNSEEAFKLFKKTPDAFDLVITDMTMPKITGTELIKKLIECRPDIPTILCTGFSEMINAENANIMGVQGYITKPVVLKDFARTVRDILDKKAS